MIDPARVTRMVSALLKALDGRQTPKEGEAAVRRELDRLVNKWKEDEDFWASKAENESRE
jgi:hypothetical protein